MNKLFEAKVVSESNMILEEPAILALDIDEALQKVETWAQQRWTDLAPRVIEIKEIYKSVVE